ncbi:MAG: ArsR/SmtB family transcription factor [Phycisphaerales bacterium]
MPGPAPISPARLDRAFAALASPARRRMLDLVQANPGLSIADLAARFRMSAVGVLKHVRNLERAGLLLSRREGRVRRLFFNPVPIQQIYDRWTDRYTSFWSARMVDIKERLEARAASAPADAPAPQRKVVRSA